MVNFRKQKLPFYWVSSGTPPYRAGLSAAPFRQPHCRGCEPAFSLLHPRRTSQQPLTQRLEYLIVRGPFSTIVPSTCRCWCLLTPNPFTPRRCPATAFSSPSKKMIGLHTFAVTFARANGISEPHLHQIATVATLNSQAGNVWTDRNKRPI